MRCIQVLFTLYYYEFLIVCISAFTPESREDIERELNNTPKADSTLILAHVYFRHGARIAPEKATYPTDPYMYQSYWPLPRGGLRLEGKLTSYKLGVELRYRYGWFLGQVYSDDLLDAYTSNNPRTEGSLQCVFVGMFPPAESERFLVDFPWIPATYKIIPQGHMLSSFDLCENYWNMTTQVLPGSIREWLYKYLSKHTGNDVINSSTLFLTLDAIKSTMEVGLKQPDWVDQIYPEPLESEVWQFYYDIIEQRLEMAAGSIMTKLLDDTLMKLNGTLVPPRRKFFLYSGHEQTLVYIMGALNATFNRLPQYSAYVAIELHHINNTYGFKVYYNPDHNSTLQILRIFNHTEDFYPLSLFKESVNWIFKNSPPVCP